MRFDRLSRPKGSKTCSSAQKQDRTIATATWEEIYQPTFVYESTGAALPTKAPANKEGNYSSLDLFHVSDHEAMYDAAASVSTERIILTPPETTPASSKSDKEPEEETALPAEVDFRYGTEVEEEIEQLIARKNVTEARKYIPLDQDLVCIEGAQKVRETIEELGLRVLTVKESLYYCRYQARLIDGTWKYSGQPCHEHEGQNKGYSSRDDAVRHIREHHFRVARPSEKKKVCIQLYTDGSDTNHRDRERETMFLVCLTDVAPPNPRPRLRQEKMIEQSKTMQMRMMGMMTNIDLSAAISLS